MTKSIHVAAGLDLPAEDLLESAIGIIAKRGRGKSGAVKVLMEELTAVGLPFVAFDPVGILWGIRSSFDGAGPGLPVLVIGGEHGDVPLERKAGAAVARRVVAENISCVIDFSEEPKAAYREFVRDFAHELFRGNDTPRMVILEEAPELVPQKVLGDRAETFEAVERLVSRGRNKGLGVVLVSQRAATINKDVLTQIDVLVVLGLAAPQDRKAIGEWIRAWDQEGQAEVFDQGLAGLGRQEAWVWSPEAFGGIFKRVRFRDFTTFHPDKTHLRRMGWLKVRPVTADVAGAVARFRGERTSKEENVDEKERKQYDDRIKRLEHDLGVAIESAREWKEKAIKKAETRVKTLSGVPGYGAVTGVSDLEDPPAIPLAGSPPSVERERVDLHVVKETPNLTVHVVERRIEANGDSSDGRLALLIADSFFDGQVNSSRMRAEFRARGWGSWIGGAGHTNALKLMRKFAEWGFLREVGDGEFQVVAEAKARVKVKRSSE